jgi:predicted GIY-YIG superfamily endonuclease
MPKKEIDYQKSVIYKIEHLEKPELLYVGSTTDFIKRKCQHKSKCNNEKSIEYNYKLYSMIRENGGWDCFKIMIIKQYPCLNKIELLIEEECLMKELKTSLNTKKAHRTEEEIKEYYIINKDEIVEYKKNYYQLNKDKINQQNKEYRNNNKDKLNKIIICECGCKISRRNKSCHIKTLKHLNKLS